MARADLRRLLRRPDTLRVVHDLLDALRGEPITILGRRGDRIVGPEPAADTPSHPVVIDGSEIGRVWGAGAGALAMAGLLRELAFREGEKRSLARETLDRYKEITLLYDVAERVASRLDVNEIAHVILSEACRVLPGSGAAVLLLGPRSRRLEVLAQRGEEFVQAAHVGIDPELGVIGRVLRTGRAEVIEDVSDEPAYVPFDQPVRSLVCAPLRGAGGYLGVLRFTSDVPDTFTAGDLKLVTSLATQAASAIDNALLHGERMRHQQLRGHLERYSSPWLVQAAGGEDALREPVVLFTDLRQLDDTVTDANRALDRRSAVATHHVLEEGGVANRVAGDMLLAVFASGDGPHNAHHAVAAALRINAALLALEGGGGVPGVGISAAPGDGGTAQLIREPITCAAAVQGTAAGGQVKVDARVKELLVESDCTFVAAAPVPVGERVVQVYEVVA